MNIGIIGVGEIGGTLTRQFAGAGHHVKIANASGPQKLRSIAKETGATAVVLSDVVVGVDVILISIPYFAVGNLPTSMFRKVRHEIPVIDTCNYYPIVSGVIQEVVDGMNESVWVSEQIGRPVVKAYNSIFYRSLVLSSRPKDHPSRIALPIAGDDKPSKEIVARLINDSGFDAYDYGTLQDSWRQQPGSPAYCTDLTLEQLQKSIATARKDLLPERREIGLKKIIEIGADQWKELVRINREIYQCDE